MKTLWVVIHELTDKQMEQMRKFRNGPEYKHNLYKQYKVYNILHTNDKKMDYLVVNIGKTEKLSQKIKVGSIVHIASRDKFQMDQIFKCKTKTIKILEKYREIFL